MRGSSPRLPGPATVLLLHLFQAPFKTAFGTAGGLLSPPRATAHHLARLRRPAIPLALSPAVTTRVADQLLRRGFHHRLDGQHPLSFAFRVRALPEITALMAAMRPPRCVARRSHAPGMLPPRALRSGRLGAQNDTLISGRALTARRSAGRSHRDDVARVGGTIVVSILPFSMVTPITMNSRSVVPLFTMACGSLILIGIASPLRIGAIRFPLQQIPCPPLHRRFLQAVVPGAVPATLPAEARMIHPAIGPEKNRQGRALACTGRPPCPPSMFSDGWSSSDRAASSGIRFWLQRHADAIVADVRAPAFPFHRRDADVQPLRRTVGRIVNGV